MGEERKDQEAQHKQGLKGERRCRSEEAAWRSGVFGGCFDFESVAPHGWV